MLRVGEHEINSGPPQTSDKGRYNRYNFRTVAPGMQGSNPETSKVVTFRAPYIDAADMGTVFIYLRTTKSTFSDS
jgi:hypothetical protein